MFARTVSDVPAGVPPHPILGRSETIERLRARLPLLAAARRTTLITGATGTGKEVVARGLHGATGSGERPFVPVHCGALPENLAESELFGHTRGAYTGASHARNGLIRSAKGGTLFLDEIDSLTLPLQAKLLRFLESGEVRAVGADSAQRCGDIWVLAATNKDLQQEVKRGAFREDLLYRIDVMRVSIPSLAQRAEDIELLAEHFLDALGSPGLSFSRSARRAMLRHSWPGNVRELKHRVERAALLGQGEVIDAEDLGLASLAPAPVAAAPVASLEEQLWRLVAEEGLSLHDAMALCERCLLSRALVEEQENRSRAAQRLQIHVRTMFKKLAEPGG